MRNDRWLGAGALFAVVLVGAVVLAQDTGEEQLLSRSDMISEAEGLIVGMTTDVETVRQMRDEAQDGDVSRYRCIRDVWTAMNGFTLVAEQALSALRGASESDTELLTHQYDLIQVAHQRVSSGPPEARQCVGSEQFFAGGEGVRTSEADSRIPRYDVTGTGRLIDIWTRFIRDEYPESSPFI